MPGLADAVAPDQRTLGLCHAPRLGKPVHGTSFGQRLRLFRCCLDTNCFIRGRIRPSTVDTHLDSLKSHFLNLPYFITRAVIYFAIWFLMITLLNRWSAIQDRPYDTWLGRKFNIGPVLSAWSFISGR